MINGKVTLCDIDNTIYVNDFYIGTYHYDHDNTISFGVFVSGIGGYDGHGDSEEEVVDMITSWLDY